MFNYLASSNQNTRPRPLQDPASSAAGRGRRLGNNVDFLEAQRQRLPHHSAHTTNAAAGGEASLVAPMPPTPVLAQPTMQSDNHVGSSTPFTTPTLGQHTPAFSTGSLLRQLTTPQVASSRRSDPFSAATAAEMLKITNLSFGANSAPMSNFSAGSTDTALDPRNLYNARLYVVGFRP